MKKTLFAFLFTCCSLIFSSISSFAGEWKLDETGYWYQNDDFTYPVSGWQWIDGNLDGVYECYCFDENGYLLTNTTTPDDDYDLTDTVEESDSFFDHDNIDSVTYEDSTLSGISSTPYDGYTIVVNTSTQKYHVIGCRAIKKMNDINKGYADDEGYLLGLGYQPCKICH